MNELTLALLSRFTIALICVYLLSKMLGPWILNFINEKIWGVKPKHDVDLDHLIERKKQMLRRGEMGPPPVPTQAAPTTRERRRFQSKTEEYFSLRFEELTQKGQKDSVEQTEQQAIKQLLTLMDGLNWGDGAQFKNLQTKYQDLLPISLPGSTLNRVFRECIQKNTLLPGSPLQLFTKQKTFQLEKLQAFLALRSLAELLLYDPEHRTSSLDKLANKWSSEPIAIASAYQYLLLKNSSLEKHKAETKVFLAYYEKHMERGNDHPLYPPMKDQAVDYLYSAFNHYLGQAQQDPVALMLSDLEIETQFFQLLRPIVLSQVPESGELLRVFQLREAPDKITYDIIKKRYKELVSRYHPDKFSGNDMPEKLLKRINDNFVIIQQAYSELQKIYKKQEA